MIPLSTAGWRFGSIWMTFRADLGDKAPPHIWAKRLSWELSGPSILCISWSVRMGYILWRTCAHSSLEGPWGEEGLVDMGDSALGLERPSPDMLRCKCNQPRASPALVSTGTGHYDVCFVLPPIVLCTISLGAAACCLTHSFSSYRCPISCSLYCIGMTCGGPCSAPDY